MVDDKLKERRQKKAGKGRNGGMEGRVGEEEKCKKKKKSQENFQTHCLMVKFPLCSTCSRTSQGFSTSQRDPGKKS